MTNQGASSSTSSTHSYAYDVSVTYNCADTRAFSCHLHNALCGMGIKTYLHEEPFMENMSATFLERYEQSKISLIVFSKTFAPSTWFEQLAKIIHRRKSKQQLVQPIFYKVDPTSGGYQSVWKAAFSDLENWSRWCFLEGFDSHFIHMVVKYISTMLPNGSSIDVGMHTVGLGYRVQEVRRLLKIGENSVPMVGIWDMGGIGKTTLAKSVYNSVAHRFERACFLANVRERSMFHEGIVQLQETLLADILEDRSLRVTDVYQGMQLIREKLSRKRVLLVLDDVSDHKTLRTLACSTWFGSGSRIIITTRDRHILREVGTIVHVDLLNHEEALELFSWHAFEGQPFGDYAELSLKVIQYAYGLPLLLILSGRHLRGRSVDEWKETTSRYRVAGPHNEVEYVLRQSYSALDDTLRMVFLDIACFFKGKKMKYVQRILENSGLEFAATAIQELVEKALITIQNEPLVGEVISMHDLIEDMGRNIVRQESKEPGERSRLWHHEDVDHVLTSNTGTDKIRGIMVKFPNRDEICMHLRSSEHFTNMKNLKFFISGDTCLSWDLFHSGLLEEVPQLISRL